MANLQVMKNRGSITELKDKVLRLQARASGALKKADKVVATGLRSVVVGATGLGCGVVQGLYGPQEVMGVPFELLGAIGAHAAGFAGVGGGLAQQMHAVGDGFLAAYAVTVGRGLGQSMAAKKAAEGG